MRGNDAADAPGSRPLELVVLGLSISSSWGNGHATTYRALMRGLAELGHRVLFLERDMPWYANSRDTPNPEGCRLELYSSVGELQQRFEQAVRDADAVIVGSYVPDGPEVLDWVLATARGLRLFYDIDTPVTLGQLRRGEATYIEPRHYPVLDAVLSFTGGPVLTELEHELGARLALPLYCSVDADRYVPAETPPLRDLGYLGTYSADRQPTLERLLLEPARVLTRARFVVAGSCYPEQDWPPNVERLDHVPPDGHPAFYGSQRFTLNVTRADMIRCGYSPSVRLFEAAACGVPIISDRWNGIDDFFQPGKEILLADDTADVLRILGDLGADERRAMAERARGRVLREHTARTRAKELAEYVRELSAGRSARLRAKAPRRASSMPSTTHASESRPRPDLLPSAGES